MAVGAERNTPRARGVVLAGGRSHRLGRNKATLVVGGESLAERAARKLAAVCGDVVIADRGKGLLPGRPSVQDGAGEGPAAGILGAAMVDAPRPLLVLGCDLPCVSTELLEHLLTLGTQGWDWVVPRHDGRLEPLCSLYGPRALETLARQVGQGELALQRLAAASLRIRFVDTPDLSRFEDPERLFFNLNTRKDLDHLLAEEDDERRTP